MQRVSAADLLQMSNDNRTMYSQIKISTTKKQKAARQTIPILPGSTYRFYEPIGAKFQHTLWNHETTKNHWINFNCMNFSLLWQDHYRAYEQEGKPNSNSWSLQRLYVVGRNFFLLMLNFSAWPSLVPASLNLFLLIAATIYLWKVREYPHTK